MGPVRAEHLGPPFPFSMEVRSYRSPNPALETDRSLRDLDTYQHLLTLLIHGRIGYTHHPAERQWTAVKRRNRVEYHLLYAGFDTGVDGRRDDFSKRRVPPAPTYLGPDYYDHLWSRDDQLHMPGTVAEDLAIFDALPAGLQSRFNRACYWYSLGVQFRKEQSVSTVAFSTAVECLLPQIRGASCLSCGKPAGPGPTKHFREHLRKYGTVPPSVHGHRDAIYGVRSALVHGSYAHRPDDGPFRRQPSFVDQLLIEIVVQRSLLGWLRDPALQS